MAKDEGPWRDSALRALAKRQVPLPFTASEVTHDQLRRKFRRVLLALGVAEQRRSTIGPLAQPQARQPAPSGQQDEGVNGQVRQKPEVVPGGQAQAGAGLAKPLKAL